jgi:hypothetical protein
LLSDPHLEVLRGIIRTAEIGADAGSEGDQAEAEDADSDLDTQLAESIRTLREYFRGWRGLVEPPEIGGFLSVLGDWSSMAALADEYLAPRSRFGVRNRMGWRALPDWVGGGGLDIHQAMAKKRFLVKVSGARTCRVRNIFGEDFDAAVAERIDEIILPVRKSEEWFGRRKLVYVLSLRLVDPSELANGQRLSEVLKRSTATVLRDVYCQNHPTLEELWGDLAKSEQLGIRIAQGMILGTGFFYLRQLRVQNDARIREITLVQNNS